MPKEQIISAEDEFDAIFDETKESEALDVEASVEPVEASEGELVEATAEATKEPTEEATAEVIEEVIDPWADAPDALKTQYQALSDQNEKLEQSNKSHAGRLGAMQRQLNQFKSTPADKPSADEVSEAMETPAKWAEFQTEYPEIHAAVESRIDQATRQNQNQTQQLIEQAIQPLRAAEHNRTETQEMAALGAAHNDWEQVIASDDFTSWMAGQPEGMHQMLNGETAHDVSTVLNVYKGAQPAPQNSTITDLKAQRQAQLKQSAGIQTKPGPGAVGVIPNDWDGAWDAIADG